MIYEAKRYVVTNPQTYHTNSIGADTSEQAIRISSIGTDEGEKTYVSTHTF